MKAMLDSWQCSPTRWTATGKAGQGLYLSTTPMTGAPSSCSSGSAPSTSTLKSASAYLPTQGHQEHVSQLPAGSVQVYRCTVCPACESMQVQPASHHVCFMAASAQASPMQCLQFCECTSPCALPGSCPAAAWCARTLQPPPGQRCWAASPASTQL